MYWNVCWTENFSRTNNVTIKPGFVKKDEKDLLIVSGRGRKKAGVRRRRKEKEGEGREEGKEMKNCIGLGRDVLLARLTGIKGRRGEDGGKGKE